MSNRKDGELGDGMCVVVRNNNIDSAIRVLKKKLDDDGIFDQLAMRERYMKPSVERRLKKKQAVLRWKRKREEIESAM